MQLAIRTRCIDNGNDSPILLGFAVRYGGRTIWNGFLTGHFSSTVASILLLRPIGRYLKLVDTGIKKLSIFYVCIANIVRRHRLLRSMLPFRGLFVCHIRALCSNGRR